MTGIKTSYEEVQLGFIFVRIKSWDTLFNHRKKLPGIFHENKQKHQPGDIVLMNRQILSTSIKRNV